MVIVTGRLPDILAMTTQALNEQGVTARVVPFAGSSDGSELFDRAWSEHPSHVIAVDALPPFACEGTPAPSDDALLTEVMRVAQSPAHPTVVWVTAQRSDDDDALRKIRRSGAPYVIVRTGRVVRRADLEPAPMPGQNILVPPDLPAPSDGLCTVPSIAAALAAVIVDDNSMGRTIVASLSGPNTWCSVIESLGARPRAVSKAGARWSRWILGRSVLRLADSVASKHAAEASGRATPMPWTAAAELGGMAWPFVIGPGADLPTSKNTELFDPELAGSAGEKRPNRRVLA